MATVVKADVGGLLSGQQVLGDLVDIGGGVVVFQLKVTAAGGGGGTPPFDLTQIAGDAVVTGGVDGLLAVAGNVASGDPDAGNPVKIGLIYNLVPPTVATGERVDAQADANGNLKINLATRLDPTNDQVGIMPVAVTKSVAVTTSGAGYVSGDVVGGIISLTAINFAGGRRVKLDSIAVKDKDNQAPALHIYFFKATPAAGTYTDNSALAWGAGDMANMVGALSVLSSDYIADNSQASVTYGNIGLAMTVSATTLFMLIVAQGAYTLTDGNLTMELNFDQE